MVFFFSVLIKSSRKLFPNFQKKKKKIDFVFIISKIRFWLKKYFVFFVSNGKNMKNTNPEIK